MNDLHPLGYYRRKISLFGYSVRLHVWTRAGSENPHDHRWPFLSIPLAGEFLDVRFEACGGADYEAQRTFPDRGLGRAYVPQGPSGLRELYRTVRRPLRPWLCRRGEIHAFSPLGSGRHVSLVITGRERTASTVWSAR